MSFVEIERINCADDEGNKYVVIVRQEIISKSFGGVVQKIKGHKDFILSDGRHVKMIGKDYKTFEILDSNEARIKAVE
ncbi:hypothetical protein ACFOLL_17015 [Falsochrobactrum ovis]|uniref:Uncharacterized protein n=1 Tax=Falsochrobactrum ovis TaxID=1293442 RepID=A0A364JT36_9HYPH|nr:hypothetical protein [Falsochrobactrum ovis]RAK26794.1 hypothetical protein C7374_11215 [Falsochrobactrum ovis]